MENEKKNYWYDASNDKFVNMVKNWIIDPKKVERIALEESISLAWMFLTTESAIVEKPKKDNDDLWWMPPQMWWMWGMWWMPMM